MSDQAAFISVQQDAEVDVEESTTKLATEGVAESRR